MQCRSSCESCLTSVPNRYPAALQFWQRLRNRSVSLHGRVRSLLLPLDLLWHASCRGHRPLSLRDSFIFTKGKLGVCRCQQARTCRDWRGRFGRQALRWFLACTSARLQDRFVSCQKHTTWHLQVLDIRTESAEVLLSLAALSGSYQAQSSASRRQLKADIEEQGITNYERFLSAADAVIGVRASACICSFPIAACDVTHCCRLWRRCMANWMLYQQAALLSMLR